MDTISSKIPNKLPKSQTMFLILQINLNRICPALIFANNRKQRVIGRTLKLINSTKQRKGTRYQGEFEGKRTEKVRSFTIRIATLAIHKLKARVKLNLNEVVTANL